MSRVFETYWSDHKPIYLAFKLPNYIPKYHHIGFLNNNNNNKTLTIIIRPK
jgi:hypothetical protein